MSREGGDAVKGPWVAGAVIAGRYRLERLLGIGGMGVVWAATHSVTRRPVALKFLLAGEQSMQARRRFMREARAAAAVRHPNVVDIYDLLELEDGSPVMVMELLSGESLAERLLRAPRMRLGEAASLALQIVAAVGSAHAVGIIHRDLKPENIFLQGGSHEDVKVLDFGIAKLIAVEGDLARSTDLTASGVMLGTPFYMAPEQLFGEQEIDHRIDIWALGLILYECLSGVLPTRAENLGQVLRIIVTETIPPLKGLVPDLASDVADLVDRMLSRDRDARPTDMRQVAEILVRHAASSAFGRGAPGRQIIEDDGDANPLTATKAVKRRPIRTTELPSTAPNNLTPQRSSEATKTVLWVEDDAFALQSMSSCLVDLGYEVVAAKNAKQALGILGAGHPRVRCAIIDLMFPGPGNAIEPAGLRLARTVKKRWPDLPLACLSNITHPQAAQWFRAHGIGYFQKQRLEDSYAPFVRAIEIATTGRPPPPRALIVHAGSEGLMRELRDYLTVDLGWSKVEVLREIPSEGRSILRKFTDESREIDVLFVLLSADDTTLASRDEQIPGKGPDLGFELGYLIGSVRRRSLTTILMTTGDAPPPLAMADLVQIRADGGVRSVTTELRAALDQWL